MGLSKCLTNECILIRKTDKGMVIVCLYIDDTLRTGDKNAIGETRTEETISQPRKKVR